MVLYLSRRYNGDEKWLKAVAFSMVLMLVIPVAVSQCEQTVAKAATKKPKLNVKNNKKTLYVVDKFKIKVTNYSDKFKWSSSNKKVATVDKNGVIKAKKAGVATISTTKDQYWIYCTVAVKEKKKPAENKPVDITPKFNAEEAKSKITFIPISADNTLYKVTSTYDIPTAVTANYKIIDNDGITINKSFTCVLATAWGDSYIKIPSSSSDKTVRISYTYADCSNISKDKYNNLMNSIEICKFEDVTGDIMGYGNTWRYRYDVYLKNTSNISIRGDIGFMLYDDNGELLPYQANSKIYINIDPNETMKYTIDVLQEVKNINDPYEDITNNRRH